jgi:hypothetical protein
LNINYERKLFRFADDFRDSISSALMTRRGQRDLCAPAKRRICDPHIVGRDDNGVQVFGAPATFPNVAKKWLSSN